MEDVLDVYHRPFDPAYPVVCMDEADRRPSHADRRKALRRHIMEYELSTLAAIRRLPRKILQLSQRLMELAN